MTPQDDLVERALECAGALDLSRDLSPAKALLREAAARIEALEAERDQVVRAHDATILLVGGYRSRAIRAEADLAQEQIAIEIVLRERNAAEADLLRAREHVAHLRSFHCCEDHLGDEICAASWSEWGLSASSFEAPEAKEAE